MQSLIDLDLDRILQYSDLTSQHLGSFGEIVYSFKHPCIRQLLSFLFELQIRSTPCLSFICIW